MKPEDIATPRETVDALLKSANRQHGAVPLRRSFVQQGTRSVPEPGPLAALVRNGDRRGLDLFLLLKAVASSEPYNSHRGASVWARALSHTGVPTDEQAISKIWSRLDNKHGLVARSRYGRLADVTLLREDGSRRAYVHPGKSREPYFQLPVAYWLNEDEEWSATLTLPAKALLLIALSLQPGFALPVEKAPHWYGLSADSAQRGLAELAKRKVLNRARIPKKAPLAPRGFTYDTRYTTQGDLRLQPRAQE